MNTPYRVAPDTIKPALPGKSDHYSWNLYRFIRKEPSFNRVFIDSDDALWLGAVSLENQLVGARLSTLLRNHRTFSCFSIAITPDMKEITDAFWTHYHAQGVCFLDSGYHHFLQEGDTRTCSRCGHQEHLVTTMQPATHWTSMPLSIEPSTQLRNAKEPS
jgi:hypothetical protein